MPNRPTLGQGVGAMPSPFMPAAPRIEQAGNVARPNLRIGQPFAGGYFADRYFLGSEERVLVVSDRPVRSVPIIHEPDATDLPTEGHIVDRIDLSGQGIGRIEAVLERFINEDSGRFYGRTADLVQAIAELAEGR